MLTLWKAVCSHRAGPCAHSLLVRVPTPCKAVFSLHAGRVFTPWKGVCSLHGEPCAHSMGSRVLTPRMLDFGQFDFGQFDFGQLAEIELAEIEIGRSRN